MENEKLFQVYGLPVAAIYLFGQEKSKQNCCQIDWCIAFFVHLSIEQKNPIPELLE